MPRPRILRQADLRKKVRPPTLRPDRRKPPLRVEQILSWAKAHCGRTGEWPTKGSGEVFKVPWQTWNSINVALMRGWRGLPKGLTLVTLLWKRLGVRNRWRPPQLTIAQILAWADSHHARTKAWPRVTSGPIARAPGETWGNVNQALEKRTRGLKTGGSLARLLERRRGVRIINHPPPLTIDKILRWADEHHARTGDWPNINSGDVLGHPGENWGLIRVCLQNGLRGLRRGSLTRLLHARRGARVLRAPPRLTTRMILHWADEYHERTGAWPELRCGPIAGAPGETWSGINAALIVGRRRLRDGLTLKQLLERERGLWRPMHPPPLTVSQILAAADAHRQRTGRWPTTGSGPSPELNESKWGIIDSALRRGLRGLPGGSSLRDLLAKHRGIA